MKFCYVYIYAAALAAAQAPRVGDIEFYGLHKLSEQKLLHALHVKPGDPLPPSKGDLEDELEQIPGVVLAHVEAVCCEAGKTTLFMGIEEKGAPHLAFHSARRATPSCPAKSWRCTSSFLDAVHDAARRGSTGEDLTMGHSLMADPDGALLQYQFIDFTAGHLCRCCATCCAIPATTSSGPWPPPSSVMRRIKKEVLNDLEYATAGSGRSRARQCAARAERYRGAGAPAAEPGNSCLRPPGSSRC